MSKPWVWLPCLALMVAGLRRSARLLPVLRRWPPLGDLLVSFEMAQWCELLALQLQSGLSILNCLGGHEGLRQGLIEGEEFWRCLRQQGYPRLVSEMVRAGEESGRLAEMLGWLATYYGEDFQNRLEALIRLIEPLVMVFLGIVAGALMIATLQPMAKALQSL